MAIGRILNSVEDTLIRGAASGAKAVHRKAPLFKDVDKNVSNLWIGKKEGLGMKIGATAAVGGAIAYTHASQPYKDPRVGQTDYTGIAPIMDADGVGQTTKAPTLGASGDMVFGMHNGRKG